MSLFWQFSTLMAVVIVGMALSWMQTLTTLERASAEQRVLRDQLLALVRDESSRLESHVDASMRRVLDEV